MKDSDRIDALALPHVPALHAYTPGTQPDGQGWIKLNTNELPYPCSPKVADAIQGELARLPLYPNPRSWPLREAVAQHHGLKPEQVIIGNGSDDILNLLMRTFCGGGHAAAMTLPSYSLYPVLSAIQNGKMEQVPFGRDMKLPVEAIAKSTANIFFLTSPNAPTGVGFAADEIRNAAARFRGIFVIDEAYADFADGDAVQLLHAQPNVVVTRTFSKSYGLAGLRVGYALAAPATIALLDRVRDSYNVNRLSQAGALAALKDVDYYRDIIGKVKQTRDAFAASLRERGWFVYPSQSNFLFGEVRSSDGRKGAASAKSLFDHLTANRILVRYFPGNPLTESFLRISVGTPEHMQKTLEQIDQWRNNA